jgi:hypothetical protein
MMRRILRKVISFGIIREWRRTDGMNDCLAAISDPENSKFRVIEHFSLKTRSIATVQMERGLASGLSGIERSPEGDPHYPAHENRHSKEREVRKLVATCDFGQYSS